MDIPCGFFNILGSTEELEKYYPLLARRYGDLFAGAAGEGHENVPEIVITVRADPTSRGRRSHCGTGKRSRAGRHTRTACPTFTSWPARVVRVGGVAD